MCVPFGVEDVGFWTIALARLALCPCAVLLLFRNRVPTLFGAGAGRGGVGINNILVIFAQNHDFFFEFFNFDPKSLWTLVCMDNGGLERFCSLLAVQWHLEIFESLIFSLKKSLSAKQLFSGETFFSDNRFLPTKTFFPNILLPTKNFFSINNAIKKISKQQFFPDKVFFPNEKDLPHEAFFQKKKNLSTNKHGFF